MTTKGSIGVFDSGFGGVNTLRSLVAALPEYEYVYLGDSARAPYGSRSQDLIYEFSKQAVDFLFAHGSELIVFACNTASSEALRKIQREYLPERYPDKNVLGVLVPAAEEAAVRTVNKKVGVIATEGTVRSKAFARELQSRDSAIQIFQQACPLLVPIVEAGAIHSEKTRIVLESYLTPLIRENIDTLILGCTHYGVLGQQIRSIMGPDSVIISEADVVPRKLKEYLVRHADINDRLNCRGLVKFYSTDLTDTFVKLGSDFFGQPITVQRVSLG